MIREIGCIELANGRITKFHSDSFGKSFYAVDYDGWGYLNIFDESKERSAVVSLLDRDIACQDRDGNLPILLFNEDEELLFAKYCELLEQDDFDYDKAEEAFVTSAEFINYQNGNHE